MSTAQKCLLPLLALACVQCGQPPEGLWQRWSIDSRGDGADGVHAADINGDGYLDLVSGWEQSGHIRLYLNPGADGIRSDDAWSSVDLLNGARRRGVEDSAFADLDLDGSPDAVISSVEGHTRSLEIHWLVGDQIEDPGSWVTVALSPGIIAGYMKARAAQIDGSGGADIVAGTKAMDDEAAGVYWFQSPEVASPENVGEWQRYLVGEVDAKTTTLAIRDMDDDDALDIVYSGRYGVGWFRNPGHEPLQTDPVSASWERVVISAIGSEFTFCDSMRDGSRNLINVTAQGSNMVAQWFKALDETGRRWEEYTIRSDDVRPGMASGEKFALKGVACGYVDGDDTIDLVFTASGVGYGVFIMSPRSEMGAGEPWQLTPLSGRADSMKYDNLELVDMDGDGDLDIATTEEGGLFSPGQGVMWLENPLYAAPTGMPSAAERPPR